MKRPEEPRSAQWAQLEVELRRQLHKLTDRLSAVDRDLRASHDDDSEERATELENDEVLERLDASTRVEAGLILRALRRIANGTYGTCAVCGSAIDSDRLHAAPTAIACRKCAAS